MLTINLNNNKAYNATSFGASRTASKITQDLLQNSKKKQISAAEIKIVSNKYNNKLFNKLYRFKETYISRPLDRVKIKFEYAKFLRKADKYN